MLLKIILSAAIALALCSPAMAQIKKPAITGNPLEDIKTDLNGGTTASPGIKPLNGQPTFKQIGQNLQKLEKDLIDKVIVDVSAALADATLRNDVIAQPCYQAQLDFAQLLPVEWVSTSATPAIPATSTSPAVAATPAHPGPPTEIGIALGFQVARDLMNAITGNDKGSLKVACAALIGDQLSILNQMLALFGMGAITGLPVGL